MEPQEFTLNIDVFLNDVLSALGEPENHRLKQRMLKELDKRILNTLGLNMSPLISDYIMGRHPQETDMVFLLGQMINSSPRLQSAVLQCLNDFKQEMVNTLEVTA